MQSFSSLFNHLLFSFIRNSSKVKVQILPGDITEKDGYIMQNKSYDKPGGKYYRMFHRRRNCIHRLLVPSTSDVAAIVPILLKETNV